MQMIRRRDDDRVQLVELEQILDVGEDVRHSEPVSERAGLGTVVVAEGHELRAAHFREYGNMCDLRDGPDAHDADANGRLHGEDDGGWLPKK